MVKRRTKTTPKAPIDRSIAALESAIARVAGHLEDDEEAARKALDVLVRIGPLAAAPTYLALSRSPRLQFQVLSIAICLALSDKDPATSRQALLDVAKRATDPAVRSCALMMIAHLDARERNATEVTDPPGDGQCAATTSREPSKTTLRGRRK